MISGRVFFRSMMMRNESLKIIVAGGAVTASSNSTASLERLLLHNNALVPTNAIRYECLIISDECCSRIS
jgi:hypothetical protein